MLELIQGFYCGEIPLIIVSPLSMCLKSVGKYIHVAFREQLLWLHRLVAKKKSAETISQ